MGKKEIGEDANYANWREFFNREDSARENEAIILWPWQGGRIGLTDGSGTGMGGVVNGNLNTRLLLLGALLLRGVAVGF